MTRSALCAFLGSPRAGGNTDILAAAVLDSAAEAGRPTESFALRGLRIHPCTGCDRCWEGGSPCIFRDDGERLLDAMGRADVFLFATPVYWYGPTAIMKAFLDRLVVCNRPEGRALVKGKAAVLVSCWEEQGMEAVQPMVRMFELSLRYLGVEFAGRILVDGVGPRGAIEAKPDAIAMARRIGASL